ncbi:AMP-binding protein [Pseudodesulfovibrio nedwellii]|uniref:AMP-binding protein n=1 Tax=Pseudodesulfovibrio nedwellii TaxID=2973072 RepID=A0ABN6S450_9BACT|nr:MULTISPECIES: AMP-binding protein [Pseudodesulfovibrio]BDQ36862.1 AMP-binding protein [Pseudodesulfovibrio nedwellii]
MSDQIKTLKDLLESSIQQYSERTALAFVGGEPITYTQLGEHIKDLQTLLSDIGIKPGDKVAIISENMPNWAIAYFSITMMGAVVVPILQEFHPSAVHHILRHSEAKMVIASRRFIHKVEEEDFSALKTVMVMDDFSLENDEGETTSYTEALEAARERIEHFSEAALERMEHLGEAARDKISDSTKERMEHLGEAAREKVEKLEKLGGTAMERVEKIGGTARKKVDKFSDSARKFIDRKTGKGFELTEESVAAILYTSGTTGHSKGVVLLHRNLVQNCLAGIQVIPVFKTDRFMSVLPMAHTYESTVGLIIPLHCGSSIHYLQKPPTPRTLLPAMQIVRPTVMGVVPLIIEKIYKSRIKRKLTGSGVMRGLMKIGATRRKLSQVAGKKLIEAFGGELRCMCIGGAPLSPEVEQFLTDAKVPHAVGYGMTETSPLLAGALPSKQRFRAIGPALPGVQLKIVDADPETGEGEILAKGPNVMREYYKAPVDTKETFTEDGWLKTGDLGKFEDGYLYIKGRLKNMILGPSGENIYPEELESIINECEHVVESMVYEVDGKVVARIHLNHETLDEAFDVKKLIESEVRAKVIKLLEDIRKDVNTKVSTFARLHRVIEQMEPFEKTPTQKIKRFIYLDR